MRRTVVLFFLLALGLSSSVLSAKARGAVPILQGATSAWETQFTVDKLWLDGLRPGVQYTLNVFDRNREQAEYLEDSRTFETIAEQKENAVRFVMASCMPDQADLFQAAMWRAVRPAQGRDQENFQSLFRELPCERVRDGARCRIRVPDQGASILPDG